MKFALLEYEDLGGIEGAIAREAEAARPDQRGARGDRDER